MLRCHLFPRSCVTPVVLALALAVCSGLGGCDDLPATGDAVTSADGDGDVDGAADTTASHDTGTSDAGPDASHSLAPCAPCSDDAQCGASADLCVALIAEGERVCGRDCGADPMACPDTYTCLAIGDAHQCVPDAGTCRDRCAGVSCDAEERCDPFTGACRAPLSLCDDGCVHDTLCGGADDHCVALVADDEVVCARACSLTPDDCPTGYTCTAFDTGAQCVPDALTCVNRCAGLSCPSGQICDPFAGGCRLPLGPCDSMCLHDSLCGTSDADRCVLLASEDEVVCAQDCAQDPTVCGPGFYCTEFDDGEANCVPTTLTCRTDRCAGVSCPGMTGCDPLTGGCLRPLDTCEGPCTNNNACLGVDDVCLGFDAQTTFCAPSCEDTGRCPLGYGCFLLAIGKHYCIPQQQSCAFDAAPCSYETRYADCPGDGFFCTAVRPGDSGTCAPTCGSGACPAGLTCTDTHLHPETCLPYGLEAPSHCGRWASASNPVGRPCGGELSAYCPQPTPLCVRAADASTAPFCSMTCAQDADCGGGASCVSLASQATPVCVPDACAACVSTPIIAGSVADLLAEALTALGQTRCSVFLTDDHLALLPSAVRLGSVPAFQGIWRSPLRALAETRALASFLASPGGSTTPMARSRDALLEATRRAGRVVDATRQTYNVDAGQPLAAAVAELITQTGGVADRTALEADAADIPAALQQQLAPIILAMGSAHQARERVFAHLAGSTVMAELFNGGHAPFLHVDAATPLPDLAKPLVAAMFEGSFDGDEMVDAVADLLDQIARSQLVADPAWGPFAFEQDTPLGRLLVYGNEPSTYTAADARWSGDVALLVDGGGDDVYAIPCGANTSLENSVAVHLDLGGADLYRYAPLADPADIGLLPSDGLGRYVPAAPLNQDDGPVSLSNVARQGAGRLGIGILVDAGDGDDRYESLRLSQGFGLFGVGVLVDEGGNDTYVAEAASQGAAMWGVGLVLDGEGDDTYSGWHLVQGAAATSGIAALVDLSGNDGYVAVPGASNQAGVLYFTLFDRARSNASVAQGASIGRGAALGHDEHFLDWELGGGWALLFDGAGGDSYLAGAVAQGAGLLGGVGTLIEAGGDDAYDARRVMQGAAGHGGLGLCVDMTGNDLYGTTIDRLGSGHGTGDDVAVGILVDDEGDDTHTVAASGGGMGLRNGVGVLADHAGVDSYVLASERALGFASAGEGLAVGDPRRAIATVGIFVDGAGSDVYGPAAVVPVGAGDNTHWLGNDGAPGAFGVGVDGTGATGL